MPKWTQVNSNPIKKLFNPLNFFGNKLYSVGCGTLCSKTMVMLRLRPAQENNRENKFFFIFHFRLLYSLLYLGRYTKSHPCVDCKFFFTKGPSINGVTILWLFDLSPFPCHHFFQLFGSSIFPFFKVHVF